MDGDTRLRRHRHHQDACQDGQLPGEERPRLRQCVRLILTDAAIDPQLAAMAVGDLWGIGSRLAARLAAISITNPLMLKQAHGRFIRERFSVVLERTILELSGQPCIELNETPLDRKSIMASRSFGRTVKTQQKLEEAVATYTARAAEKLRRQRLAAGRLMVFVHTNRSRPQDAQYAREQAVRLPVATADTGKLTGAAHRDLAAIFREGFRYKKAGVMLLEPAPAGAVPGGLFDAPDDARAKARMRALDGLNGRYGRDTVTYAATGTRRAWKLRCEFISPRYSTSWDELLCV